MRDDFSKLKTIMEPPWDDLREQRVWARVQAKLDSSRVQPRTVLRMGWWWMGLAAGIVGLIGLGAWWFVGRKGLSGAGQRASTRKRDVPAGRSELSLGYGAMAFLGPDARVDVVVRSERKILVRQTTGTVRYRVRHRPGRSFLVDASGILVRDVGTDFTVRIFPSGDVHVSVRQGALDVRVHGSWRRLDMGMELTVARREHKIVPDAGEKEPGTDAGVRRRSTAEPHRRIDQRWRSRPRDSVASEPLQGGDIKALFKKVDEARGAGRLADAARVLRRIIRAFPGDSLVTVALFTLGRVEAARGRSTAAALAFRRCHRRAPSGPLAEDSLAAESRAWSRAGRRDLARRAASAYLRKYPAGAHARFMAKLSRMPDAKANNASSVEPSSAVHQTTSRRTR